MLDIVIMTAEEFGWEFEKAVKIYNALKAVKENAKNEYALSYLNAIPQAIREGGEKGLKIQILYLLNNLPSWRGELARESKLILKKYAKE